MERGIVEMISCRTWQGNRSTSAHVELGKSQAPHHRRAAEPGNACCAPTAQAEAHRASRLRLRPSSMDRDAFRSYFAMHNVDVHPVALDSGTAAVAGAVGDLSGATPMWDSRMPQWRARRQVLIGRTMPTNMCARDDLVAIRTGVAAHDLRCS
jgi:hypothetical protein